MFSNQIYLHARRVLRSPIGPNDNGFAANAKWISHFCVNIFEAMSRR